MNLKFLSGVVFSVLACSFAYAQDKTHLASIWESSPTGKCFDSLGQYMNQTFGSGYEEDENIVATQVLVKGSGTRYYWVGDKTPTINWTSTLFSVDAKGGACAILFVPFSTGLTFELGRDGQLPRRAMSVDTPPPGYPETRIIYSLRKSKGIYVPTRCEHVLNGRVKIVDCNSVFESN